MTAIAEPGYLDAAQVYRPQDDTRLLIGAIDRKLVAGRDVGDLCTGSGVVAVHSAELGAKSVTAVDSSPAAIASVRRLISTSESGGCVTAVHNDIGLLRHAAGFDVITCNPPYVPTPEVDDPELHPPGPSHCWDAGPRGRAVLDVVCSTAPTLLRPGGTLLLVQSEYADIPATIAALTRSGLSTRVAAEAEIPFGPVFSARADWMEKQGLLKPGRRRELLAVIRAERAG
ncbi:hypothetical protein GOEFS_038_00010 [Gordonia effusa NBRC 100432]|uniref:Methyltransferase small domain-containing protein n=1 Tax=Gordonia effusa NBRC 100432 TaxID=1077974 RepID=H0QY33_9ACTN|nr:methyltransferase [Gordonia effusa]GAB17734.1 hypothetical protein GOEFS_038_00010 [Gordonia effusa NBRC 100432]